MSGKPVGLHIPAGVLPEKSLARGFNAGAQDPKEDFLSAGTEVARGLVILGQVAALAEFLANSGTPEGPHNPLATRALLAWNETPLEYKTSAKILEILMSHGANGNASTPQGDTVVERLGARLGTIEGNEGRAMARYEIRKPGPAGMILRECWAIMEDMGVDMSEAMRVRNMAMEPGL